MDWQTAPDDRVAMVRACHLARAQWPTENMGGLAASRSESAARVPLGRQQPLFVLAKGVVVDPDRLAGRHHRPLVRALVVLLRSMAGHRRVARTQLASRPGSAEI